MVQGIGCSLAVTVAFALCATVQGYPPASGSYGRDDVAAKVQSDHEQLHTVTLVGNNKVYGLLSYVEPRDAKLEKEDLGSAILTKYDGFQEKLVEKAKAPAVVDQTSKRDFFGNKGEDEAVRRKIIDIAEYLSNLANAIIEKIPKGIVQQSNKAVLNKLNQVGAVLVGLEDP